MLDGVVLSSSQKLECEYFGKCASCTLSGDFDEQREYKISQIKGKFKEFYDGEFEFFGSPLEFYRNRAEFGLFRDGENLSYTMNGMDEKYLKISQCKKVQKEIFEFMPGLLESLNSFDILKHKIFGVEFLNATNSLSVVLLYHQNIEKIRDELANLREILQEKYQKDNFTINLVARSRGKKLVFGSENLRSDMEILGRKFSLEFGISAFLQPNSGVNTKMISWVKSHIFGPKDLLEMYCGHGNFTIPLVDKFRAVLATEISKESIKNAKINCQINGVNNIKFARISSDELMSAFAGIREFRRLMAENIKLDEYDFSHILVDPPRAGLEKSVINFIKNYENIIYISCNPTTLKENLGELCKTHKVLKFAIFDQFPNTFHTECGVILKKFE
ncbi:MAG: tRNA (uridine(54)-C5)-methyltransferase TrmA [Campylobacter sp.]|nr:tRNA (uridine(54)-C5)-methyltransferase TrmA [Campylobacter sp.]